MELTVESAGRDKDLLESKTREPGQVSPGQLQTGPARGENGDNGAAGPRVWTPKESARLYGIRNWGHGYFNVNDEGHVTVHPNQDPVKSVDLKKLVDELRERDIQLPCLIRFTDILKHRVGQLHTAFANAIHDHEY